MTGTRCKLLVGDWNGDGSSDLAWFVAPERQDTVLYNALSTVGAAPVPDPAPDPAPDQADPPPTDPAPTLDPGAETI